MIGQIREAIRLIQAGENVTIRGRVFGLHVEVTLRRVAPKVQFDPICACGHHAGDHSWGHFSCSECACDAFGLVTENPGEPASGQVQRDDVRCTGWEAVWCPLHGNCRCPYVHDREELGPTRESQSCPLHADRSEHGQEGGT